MQGAVGKTGSGGEVICVGPGDFGIVSSITTSVTINCVPGASVRSFYVDAPGGVVIVRNLMVNGLAIDNSLIQIAAAASVRLENVFVTGSTSFAVVDHRSASGRLYITNSSVVGNFGAGIVVAPPSGVSVSAVFDNVRVTDNTYGLAVGVGGRVMVKHSVFAGNSTAGVEADPGAYVALKDVMVEGNNTGVLAGNGSHIVLSNSDVDSNNTAISGSVSSYGNNSIFANIGDGTPPTPAGSLSSENGLK